MNSIAPLRPIEYDEMAEQEERLWWFRGMRTITHALLDRWYAPDGRLRILDAGCGTGGGMRLLAGYGAVTGMDLALYALRLGARRAAGPRVCANVAALPLPAGSFDLVTSFDVLTALDAPTERAALREMARVLAPGGRFLARVAAYDWLRGAHDRACRIQHRYTAGDLRQRLERVGLRVEVLSYVNMWLFPLAAAKRLAERLRPPTDRTELTAPFGAADKVLGAILASEAPLAARGWLPFGLSLLAVARKLP